MLVWSSFIFAFFCSSLSEASLDTACFFVFASAKISFTFAFWSSVRFKLSTAACKPPCIPISLPPAWGAVAACEFVGAKITASAATRHNDTNGLLIFICGSPQLISGLSCGQGTSTLLPQFGRGEKKILRLERPVAPGHGSLDGNGDERRRTLLEGIAAEDDEVGELAGFDGTFQIFFIRSIGSVDRSNADRFFHRNFLLRAPDVALGVRTRHFRLQRHHGDEFSGRIVGSLRRADVRIKKTAQREHVVQAFGAVVAHFFAVVVDVG